MIESPVTVSSRQVQPESSAKSSFLSRQNFHYPPLASPFTTLNEKTSNGVIGIHPSQLLSFVEGPNEAQHSCQSSISIGGTSRNTNSIPPTEKQYSPNSNAMVPPTYSYILPRTPPLQRPDPDDFVTQMEIPSWKDRCAAVDLLPMSSAQASSAANPVPLMDPGGHHFPPQPFAPSPVSVPPLVSNTVLMNLEDRERPNSAQNGSYAPSYRNPPAYPSPMWSKTLPLPGKQPRSDQIFRPPAPSLGPQQEQEPIWDIV